MTKHTQRDILMMLLALAVVILLALGMTEPASSQAEPTPVPMGRARPDGLVRLPLILRSIDTRFPPPIWPTLEAEP